VDDVDDVWGWPFIWAVFDVSNDVILRKPVAETKIDSVSRYFCSQITSAWNARPAHLLRADLISHPTLYDAFGPAGCHPCRPDRLEDADSFYPSPLPQNTVFVVHSKEIMKKSTKNSWGEAHRFLSAPLFFLVELDPRFLVCNDCTEFLLCALPDH
jgi:hypothetical protein